MLLYSRIASDPAEVLTFESFPSSVEQSGSIWPHLILVSCAIHGAESILRGLKMLRCQLEWDEGPDGRTITYIPDNFWQVI